ALALLDPKDDTMAAQVESIARQSGGYPIFVYELVQYLQAFRKRKIGSQAEPSEGHPSSVDLAPFDQPYELSKDDLSLSEVLWSRIVALPEEARRLLEVVAVAGQPMAQADACRAAGVADEPT